MGKGNQGNIGNEEADRLAGRGARKQALDPTDLTIPKDFRLTGVKVATSIQAILYKGIRQWSNETKHPETEQSST